MFQFTTTNVINTNEDLTTGKPLWSSQKAGETDEAGNEYKVSSLNIKRVNNFKQPNVVHIFKSEYTAPKNAKATLDLSTVGGAKGEAYRLSIYIRLSQSLQSSYYSNDMVFKGKPLSVEFNWLDTPQATAKKLADIIKKYEIAVYEKPIVKVTANGNSLVIDATDQYQRFYTVEIEKYDAKAYHGMGEYTPVIAAHEKSHEDFDTTNEIVQGVEGFGTYEWLLHNLRLPTTMRTRIYAMNSDETPIPGAKYNEYVIHYCVNRGILGTNAVGDMVKSMTTHVFYVNQAVSAAFETALLTIAPDEGIVAAIKADAGVQPGSPADKDSLPEVPGTTEP